MHGLVEIRKSKIKGFVYEWLSVSVWTIVWSYQEVSCVRMKKSLIYWLSGQWQETTRNWKPTSLEEIVVNPTVDTSIQNAESEDVDLD